MADDVSDIRAYYDNLVERENGRLERHQQEHDVTWRYLDKYLPKSGKILEVGAATGAYTIPLAKRGYNVIAVDLSPKLVNTCKKRVKEEKLEKKVKCFVADGRELKDVPGNDYDAVLIMGPLYHLVLKEDREKTVQEAYRRLKPGGVIFSALVSRYGIWGTIMARLPFLIDRQEDLRSVMENGKDVKVPEGGFRGYFTTVKEVKPLHEKAGFKTLVLAGVEPANTVADEAYSALEGERRKLWLDLLFAISTEPSIIGASDHLLYIGVKEG
ncbi:MAG: class I SAM-dependent methyltransferase [Dehalococcoidales bacterium]